MHIRHWGKIGIYVALVVIAIGACITYFSREEGALSLRINETDTTTLPFAVRLNHCEVVYYPGTATAEDFLSDLTIDDGKAQRTLHLSMNHPAKYRGWRLYQSSFDSDTKGCTLLYSHDPWGTSVVYSGYALLLLSLLICFTWKRGITAIFLLSATTLSAAPKTLQRPVAESFGRLYVEYNGRICPMSTVASDVCTTLYGHPYYKTAEGDKLTANQVLAGLFFYYDSWQDVPLKHSRKAQKMQQREMVRQMAGNGALMRIWPGKKGWYDVNDSYPGDSLSEEEGRFRVYAMQLVAYDLEQGRNVAANETLIKIRRYQQQHATDLPSERRFKAEQLYTSWHFPRPLLLRWYITRHIPMTNGAEAMQVLALLALLFGIGLWIYKRSFTHITLGAFGVSAIALMVSYISSASPQLTHLSPVLHSPLLCLHVSTMMLSYALLAILTIHSIYCLCTRQSSIEQTLRLLRPAFFTLALGIILGSLWANVSWGRYWGWDPKETWALITWLIYGIGLQWSRKVQPWLFHLYCALAFLAVLFTYFGVNYFLGGLHSYA